ncbi:MAG: molybdopterin-dependent oxidoreductase [Pseudomonadota bacterium]
MKARISGWFLFVAVLALVFPALSYSAPSVSKEREIKDFQGKHLDPFDRAYDNSIKGPQQVNPKTYRLTINGLVEFPQSLAYQEVLKLPLHERVITLHCVEGWQETLLFKGIRIKDLLERAKVKPGVKTIIFYAADGYSSSLDYMDIGRLDLLLAFEINGRTLDAKRGFPFQVVAESKLGYKWVKWVTRIELSDKPFKGFWEKKGYDNQADLK